MREQFEKLPEIVELVDQFVFSDDTNTYHIRYDDMDSDRKRLDVMYLGGAWYVFQEVHKELEVQQKKINKIIEYIDELDTGDHYMIRHIYDDIQVILND